MELVERRSFLDQLKAKFQDLEKGEGHCVFVSGEAGIGKTSLVKALCKEIKDDCAVYQGACDALFTPRPLAPLYDILWQINNESWPVSHTNEERSDLFAKVYRELSSQKKNILVVFEDVHWADEATLDFIKFLARRITQLQCLFILTYRDEEINSRHPLRNVLGQLSSDSFTRMQLPPLSREAVEKMAAEREYKGEDVYKISGGNPFYVNEILANYSLGVPDNIKDSVLSVYNKVDGNTKEVWQILSVLPTGFEMYYLKKMEPAYTAEIETCLDLKILVEKDGIIGFKHELFRRTIETSLSPLLRVALNKRILDLFRLSFEANQQVERIIHHAKNANEYDIVVHYAPLAARQAASVGAHIEAAKLFQTAIEYYQGDDKETLIQFYESYAYECYLTNQIKEAIIYSTKALDLWKEKGNVLQTGNCLRFLSRLWWYDGNRERAEFYANSSIAVLADQPASRTKALALSNMSQLKMLSYEYDESIEWGERAIEMAKELNDDEILCHALNNVGTTKSRLVISRAGGNQLLKQSLEIALEQSYHDHAGRAYANLVSNAVKMKDYKYAKAILDEGIQYCEDRDLDAYTPYLLAFKARFNLETGKWEESYHLAEYLVKNELMSPVVRIEALVILATLKMRRGETDVPFLLQEAKAKALQTMEAQRIIPTYTAIFEYEWITGTKFINEKEMETAVSMLEYKGNVLEKNEFRYWLSKSRNLAQPFPEGDNVYQVDHPRNARKISDYWKQLGCNYQQALILFEGPESDKREAISIVHMLGANAIYEKMKQEMRTAGIKSIPRGTRKSTRSNPANLTERELDVLKLLKDGLQNKEIGSRLFISPKTVDHHISAILFKLDVNSRSKAVNEAVRRKIIK